MKDMKVKLKKYWVNVFVHPLDKTRLYVSVSYPSKAAAVEGLGKGATGRKTQTFIATIAILVNAAKVKDALKIINLNQ